MRCKGTGNLRADLAFVGEGPGYFEDKGGRPFLGATGDELDRLFEQVLDGLQRKDVWLTNLYRIYQGKDYIWSAEDLARDEPELVQELNHIKPATIASLGRASTRWFLGDVDMEDVRSIPWYVDQHPKLSFPFVVVPIQHPASSLHNPESASYVVTGFQALAAYLNNELEPRVLYDDPYPEPQYEEITTPAEVQASLESLGPGDSLSIDSEGWPGREWSVQYSHEPGRACLISAKSVSALRSFHRIVHRVRPRLIFHSALHDLGMCRGLGIDLDGLDFDDTMVMAYLLQVEPQGLKPLCVRHCGMRMQSYEDVVGEASQRLATDYLTWLWDGEVFDWEQRCLEEFNRRKHEVWTDKRGKVRQGRKITKVLELPKSALHKAVQRCLQSKNVRKLWGNQVEDIQVAGYSHLGTMPEATLDYVPRPAAVRYGSRDADGTTRLLPGLRRRLDTLGLQEVYNLKLGTYPLIERMARIGVLPDLHHFASLSGRLLERIEQLRTSLCVDTGKASFNANSGDQVAALLFDELGLDGGKRTHSGRFSTNDKILEGLDRTYPDVPVISDIRTYRELYKLKYTFCDRLPDYVNRWPYDGRIHATFRTTRVVTGRLATSEPNLLAQPKHGKFAKDFRRGWKPAKGHVFGSWDLSQIELRIAAHLSQDPTMLAIYRGERRNPDGSLIDLHAVLGERIFGVKPKDQDESQHRLPSKACNFGYWMGQTAKGLQVELQKNGMQISVEDAQCWLDEMDALYPQAKVYKAQRIAEAQKTGFVRCLSGRIRYIGGINSRDERIRSEAERFAFSTPVQEGAQTVMKTNEAALWQYIILPLQREGYWIEPLLQIHDDIVLELENEKVARLVNPMMVRCMTESYRLSVPIKTSGEWGYTWCKFSAKDPHEGDMVPFGG